MKPTDFYAILVSVVYALLFSLGYFSRTDWNEEAAPWLGESPAGMSIEGARARYENEYPRTIYTLRPNEELRRKIITTFRLEECRPGRYENNGIDPIYPEGKEVVLEVSAYIYPWLEVNEDGSMSLCVNDLNLAEQKDPTKVQEAEFPYPQHLQSEGFMMIRSLLLAALCYMMPGIFCSVGWLWTQRKPLSSRGTKTICLLIPAAVAFIGAFVDFYVHGFHARYAMSGAASAVFTNLLCAGAIMGLTSIGKTLWGKPACYR